MERAEVDPVTGIRRVSELDATPVAESDTEPSAVHSPDELMELGLTVEESVTEGLADVFGNVTSDTSAVVNEPDVDDYGVASDSIPGTPEGGFGDVEPVEHTVDVDVPATVLRTPLYLGERTAAGYTLVPERTCTEGSKAGVEAVDLGRQRPVVDLEGEREKSDRLAGQGSEDVGCENATAIACTGETEAVATRRAADAVLVRSLGGLVNVSLSTAVDEGGDACDRLCCGLQGVVDDLTVVSPAGVAEGLRERAVHRIEPPGTLCRESRVYFWGFK